jgi:hypothetical protein
MRLAASLLAFLAVGGLTFVLPQTPAPPTDVVSKFAARLETGDAKLEYSGRWGYLQSLLKQLDVPIDSQVLVFSKTSLQQEKIGPKTPRAIFFNDTVSVGSVQNGELFEITVADADAGVQFYILETKKVDAPRIERERFLCLQCHNAKFAPQTFVATVYPSEDGSPAFLGGDLFHVTDSRTPFEDRWGGWYVTGTHGKMEHLGNAVARNPYRPVELETKGTQNLTSLTAKFDVTPYLEPSSDLIALMTLEHQTRAYYYMAALNAQFKAKDAKPEDLSAAIENLVSYLTFSGEAKLTSPIKGVSTFTETFPVRGPRDAKGRSLRDFDLKTRLFRYPLSYTIYTDVFDKMNPQAQERIYRRLFEILSGSGEEKKAALEILRDTKPNLPDYWR